MSNLLLGMRYFEKYLDWSVATLMGETSTKLIIFFLTNEKNMIDSIEYQSPLGKSDHSVLVFNFVCTKVKNYIGKKNEILRKLIMSRSKRSWI